MVRNRWELMRVFNFSEVIRIHAESYKTWLKTKQSQPSLMTMSATTKWTVCLTTRKIGILPNALKKSMWRPNCAITTICRAARAWEFKRRGKRKPASYQRGVEHSPLCLWVAGERHRLSPAPMFSLAPLSLPFTALPLQLLMSPVTLTVLIFIKSFFSPRCPVCDTRICVK